MKFTLVAAQLVSCGFSLVSLSWALAAYHRSLRISRADKENMSLSAAVLQFFWRLFTIASRVLAMAAFASLFPHFLFAIIGAHWVLMFIWIWMQQTTFCGEKDGWDERIFDMVAAWIHIFCFFNVTEGRTRSRYLMYYAIVYVENAMMILVWFFTVTEGAIWYKEYCAYLVLGGFWVGIMFMLIYYWFFHPNKEQIEGVWCLKQRQKPIQGCTPAASRDSSVTSRPSQVSATSPSHCTPAVAYRSGHDEVDGAETQRITFS